MNWFSFKAWILHKRLLLISKDQLDFLNHFKCQNSMIRVCPTKSRLSKSVRLEPGTESFKLVISKRKIEVTMAKYHVRKAKCKILRKKTIDFS